MEKVWYARNYDKKIANGKVMACNYEKKEANRKLMGCKKLKIWLMEDLWDVKWFRQRLWKTMRCEKQVIEKWWDVKSYEKKIDNAKDHGMQDMNKRVKEEYCEVMNNEKWCKSITQIKELKESVMEWEFEC